MAGEPPTPGGIIMAEDDWFDPVDACLLLPLPVVDMSNGAAAPIDVPDGCEVGGPAVVAVPKGAADEDDEAAVGGIEKDMPRRAAIGCHGLRAERFSSLPVILAFRNDLQIDQLKIMSTVLTIGNISWICDN